MTPHYLVAQIRASILEENHEMYRNLFNTTPMECATDAYWIDSLKLFSALDKEQKEVFLQVIRQIMVDTISNVFGVIDGVNPVGGENGEFFLTYDGDTEPLNGDLQSIFLAEEEVSK